MMREVFDAGNVVTVGSMSNNTAMSGLFFHQEFEAVRKQLRKYIAIRYSSMNTRKYNTDQQKGKKR